jgi:DNA polymerase I-like protein with 3'-5' exonuclease and polymerase domains
MMMVTLNLEPDLTKPASDLINNWLEILDKVEFVGFDTENNGHINLFDDGVQIYGFSIAVKVDSSFGSTYLSDYFPCFHLRGRNYHRDIWEPILLKVLTKKVIAHNVNFDARSARMLLGYDFDKPFEYFFDTASMCHLLDENAFDDGRPLATPSLENCCRYFKVPGKEKSLMFNMLMQTYGWMGIAGSEIEEYACADAVAVYRLWEVVASRLKKESAEILTFWRDLEMENFKVLYDMKTLGVTVDIAYCRMWEERCEREMYKIKQELGFDPAKSSELKPVIYETLGLPVIMAKRKKKDADGKRYVVETPTLDSKAMEKYEVMMEHLDNPIARKIIEFRGWSKGKSYYESYQKLVDPDGKLRPDYKSHGTLTRRYACSKPNLQQIPKEAEDKPWVKDVKKCFIPIEGHELWEFDYSQLELRLGAAFGNDTKLLEIFNDPDRDIFTEMAAEMGWPRFKTKSFVYSIDYGAGPARVRDIFNLGEGDKGIALGKQYIQEFYVKFPGLGSANERAKYEATTTGKVRYWAGHFRHFNSANEAYKAFNSKIQGGSADLVKMVMNKLRKAMPELRILLQIHDALWFEIPTEKRDYYLARIKEIMENPFPDMDRVRFAVDGHQVGGRQVAV